MTTPFLESSRDELSRYNDAIISEHPAGALCKAPFREKSCLMGKRVSLRVSQSTQGAFHLSELTGLPILIVMRISLLININHKQQSNPTHYAQTRWFFSKTSWKTSISFPKCLVWPWSGRPVLTYGKRR